MTKKQLLINELIRLEIRMDLITTEEEARLSRSGYMMLPISEIEHSIESLRYLRRMEARS